MAVMRGALTELLFQPCLHRRPLALEDRVVRRIAGRAVGAGLESAEHAVEARAEALDGAAGAVVARVGLERDAQAAPRLEGVREHEQPCLRVHHPPLPPLPNP